MFSVITAGKNFKAMEIPYPTLGMALRNIADAIQLSELTDGFGGVTISSEFEIDIIVNGKVHKHIAFKRS